MYTTNRSLFPVASVWKWMVFLFLIVATVSLTTYRTLFAAGVIQSFATIITNPLVATSTSILLSLDLADTVPPSSVITFDWTGSSFSLPSSTTPADGRILVNSVPMTVGAFPSNDTYGYQLAGQVLSITTPPNVAIQSGDHIDISFGHEGGVSTPNATGTYRLLARIVNSANQLIGGTQGAVVIVSPVQATANVESTNPEVRVLRVKPELRVGVAGTNDDVLYYLTAYAPTDINGGGCQESAANNGCDPIFRQNSIDEVAEQGEAASTVVLEGLVDSRYDFGIKTQQHLRKKLRNVLVSGNATTPLNFTDPLNGLGVGSEVLYAGDINGDGLTPSTLGDDVINSIDLSLFMNDLDGDDPTGNVVRANLNQDSVINSVDLSIMLKNLDAEGDR